jgi:uncharacterized protein YqgC (DUF456 family)
VTIVAFAAACACVVEPVIPAMLAAFDDRPAALLDHRG